MEALQIKRVKRNGRQLTADLPDNFIAEEVDIILWPSNEEVALTEKKKIIY
jgi:hypothetical protein